MLARHEDSEVSDTPLKEKAPKKKSQKEVEEERRAKEKKNQEKEEMKRDMVHRVFVAREGRGKNGRSSEAVQTGMLGAPTWRAPVRAPKTTLKEEKIKEDLSGSAKMRTVVAGSAPGTNFAETDAKQRWEEEMEVELKRKASEIANRRIEREKKKYNARIEQRRYEAFMNDPLSHHFTYPNQYLQAELERLELTNPPAEDRSRNTPGKPASQYRGTLVLSCVEWRNGCVFELKGYGPVTGGWQMRPLHHPGLKKHTVTSWCICNHPKIPFHRPTIPDFSSWSDFLAATFPTQDAFIAAAHSHAATLDPPIKLNLLALMMSDGQPKNNGRSSTYIPKAFLTLECEEAEKGCPFAIKGREEDGGWTMRPWREKGRSDLKGAVSVIACKHGSETEAAYLRKQAERDRKLALKHEGSTGGADSTPPPPPDPPSIVVPPPDDDTPSNSLNVDFSSPHDDLPSGLDPQLMSSFTNVNETGTLSPSEIMSGIQTSLQHHQHQEHQSLDETSLEHQINASHYLLDPSTFSSDPGVSGSGSALDHNFGFGPLASTSASTSALPISTPAPLPPPTKTTSKKRKAQTPAERLINKLKSAKRPNDPPLPPSEILRQQWSLFLHLLDPDPINRLQPMLEPLVSGGIDPGAVVSWPEKDLVEYLDCVSRDAGAFDGVRFQLRIKMRDEGKGIWERMSRKSIFE
ncbi:hypothetical protein MNV49_000956 [Pseudohyphozyma bogoriensis]|nr:hypothetical protein MNV49_000956 [Pseudohyphozyma bogoriensis]